MIFWSILEAIISKFTQKKILLFWNLDYDSNFEYSKLLKNGAQWIEVHVE